MSDSDSPPVKRAASSWVTAIATRPMLALIIVLLVVLLAIAATGYVVRQRTVASMIQQLKDQAASYEKTIQEREVRYLRQVGPLIAERDALKKRLGKIKPLPAPANDKELIARFKTLGY